MKSVMATWTLISVVWFWYIQCTFYYTNNNSKAIHNDFNLIRLCFVELPGSAWLVYPSDELKESGGVFTGATGSACAVLMDCQS